MKKFILNLIKFLFLPIFITSVLIYFYIYRDVYKDFYVYKNYSWKYSFQALGDLSTKKLLNSKEKYNSFIFGSSRSVSVYGCYLQKKIKDSQFFHYGNWGETVGGIYAKLRLLDSQGYNIDNVFIYFDTDFTFAGDGKCRVNDHYLLTSQNRLSYYYDHFKTFLSNDDKFKIISGSKLSPLLYPNWKSDLFTNDSRHVCTDKVINQYGENMIGIEYKRSRIDSLIQAGVLYNRDKTQKFKEKQISPSEEDLLLKIKEIFTKHNTNYYIVIPPLYDQLKFNLSDFQIIKNIFGDNVYDYSGINKFTNDVYNYPDGIHFQYYLTKQIIDSVVVNR